MNAKALSENRQASGCGRVGLALFGLIFAAFGAFFIWMTVVSPMRQSKAAQSWTKTECTIVKSKVEFHSDDDGTSYSPDIKYEFELAGQVIQGDRHSFARWSSTHQWAKEIVKKYRPGEIHPCFYNPDDPQESVLDRELNWPVGDLIMTLIISGIFLLIGLAVAAFAILGFGLFNKSAKKPKAVSDAADRSKHRHPQFSATNNLNQFTSGVHPEDALDQTWSAPRKLKPETSKWTMFLIILGIAVFWNGIVSVFVFAMIFDDVGTWGRIGLGLVLTPFVLVGLGLLIAVVYTFMSLFNPVVEVAISTGAVPLGGEVDIAWEIIGNPRRIRTLKLEIQGEQSATYRRGTTTSTDTEIFELVPICEVTDQANLEFGSTTVRIPPRTMHSFDGGNNKISWSIVVQGEIPWWPDVNAVYPFRVKPSIES